MPERILSLGKKAWEQYLDKAIVDAQMVRESVASSWQRCRALQLNPHQPVARLEDTPQVLEYRLKEKQRLLVTARPYIRDLCKLLEGTDFEVVLTDETGLLLEVTGEPRILSRTKDVELCPGADWSEAQRGTNAIGTALIERAPVQIFAWEHFQEENHFLTCSAAPICAGDGRILGVLDVSGDCRQANPHTMGMVVAVARAIETQFHLNEARHDLQILSRYSNVLAHGSSDGLLAVNQQGIIIDLNSRAGQILGVNPSLAKGTALTRISFGNAPIMRVIQGGPEYENQPILLDCNGRQIRSSALAVRDEMGSVIGAVAVFQEVQGVHGSRKSIPVHAHRRSFDDIVGESEAMRAAKEWAWLAADCNSTVLLLGESGTGKEVFASAIHGAGARSQAPFLAINCAAMPESLIESELFGYCDGSFTGARKGGQAGKFEQANGGTVFLDEIGEMTLPMQAKLLRVLQERTVQRIGSSRDIQVDIRIVAATHRNLSRDVEEGRFREDLYYRIAVLEVKIPPLRERVDDVPALSRCLLRKICLRLGRQPVDICEDAIAKLSSYQWPGNVRQLENVLERAVVALRGGLRLSAASIQIPEQSVPGSREERPAPAPQPQANPVSRSTRPLRDTEKDAIREALRESCGNIKRAAARLGIARNTLYRKMVEYELAPEEDSAPS